MVSKSQYSAFAHFASIVPGDVPMAMFSVFFDDSGTHAQSPVAIAACVLSDKQRWKRFDTKWAEVLSDEGFSSFHMSEFMAIPRRGDFVTWDDVKAYRVFNALTAIAKECVWVGHVTAVFKDDYDQIITGQLREKVGTYHYTFAVQSCLAHMEPHLRQHAPKGAQVQYIFDRMSEGKGEILNLFTDLLRDPIGDYFGIKAGGWAFQDKKAFLPLQAADVLAWEAYRYMMNNVVGKPNHLAPPFVTQLGTWLSGSRFFNARSLTEFADEVRGKYAQLNWKAAKGAFFLPDK